MALILASSSPYRQRLLQRLGLPFESVSPEVDESPLTGESPGALARRLAAAKAATIATVRTAKTSQEERTSQDMKIKPPQKTENRESGIPIQHTHRMISSNTNTLSKLNGMAPSQDTMNTSLKWKVSTSKTELGSCLTKLFRKHTAILV